MPAVGFLMFLCHFFWFWVHAVTHGQSRLEPPDTVKRLRRCNTIGFGDLVPVAQHTKISKISKIKRIQKVPHEM